MLESTTIMRALICAVVVSLIFVSPSNGQARRYGSLGSLVVTATAMSTAAAHEEGQHYVTIFVRVRNGGTDRACASLSGQLKASDNVTYSEAAHLPGGLDAPASPRVSQLLHGGESNGAYVFETKNGVDPLTLIVNLDSQGTMCDSPSDQTNAPVSQEIDLDVHDLPAPAAGQVAGKADIPAAGSRGYGTPRCFYMPSAPFTDKAVKAKVQGSIELVATVSADGNMTDIHVLKGLGYGLDASAVEAVSRWRCEPAPGPDGKPAAVRTIIEMSFTHR